MRILIVGATGVLGRPLTSRLLAEGHQVFGIHRSSRSGDLLRQLGAKPLRTDVFDAASVGEAFDLARPEVVIHQLTALPQSASPRAMKKGVRLTAELRRRTVPLFAQRARLAGARLLAQSMSFVTRPEGPPIQDETAPLWLDGPRAIADTNEAIRILEDATVAVGGTALRYGFLYGPGTWYSKEGAVGHLVQRRMLPITGKGEGLSSFVHVDDAVEATVLAMTHAGAGIFNICDDEPVSQREYLPVLAELLEAKRPRRVPAALVRMLAGPAAAYYGTSLRGASNARAKAALHFKPRSWRRGFAQEFAAAR